MKTYNIFTNEEDSLPEGKADFLLLTDGSLNSKLEIEYLQHEQVISGDKLPKLENNIPNPVIITRAVHNLVSFSALEGLALDFKNMDAKKIFVKGMSLGETYEIKGSFLILAHNFKTIPLEFSEILNFEILNTYEDKILIFLAGFIMNASKRFHVVLAGEKDMKDTLIIADRLRETVLQRVKHNNITLVTSNSNGLSTLSYIPHAIFTNFSFEASDIESLRKSRTVEASISYASANKITNQELLEQIEYLIYMM